jgi:DNA-binding transcriptional MerR regulator
MQYKVEQLAAAAGVRVDTIRFYQRQGLLPAPRRAGRYAVYSAQHLARLRRIQRLQAEGFPLAVIRRLLAPGGRAGRGALLRALSAERGTRRLSRAQVAAEAGVPEPLIAAVESAGIVEPERVGTRPRYGELDVEMAREALAVLRAGFPLPELLAIAIRHAEHVRSLTDRMIDLFDGHVRREADGTEREPDEIVAHFQQLLPRVVALVAHHFQRTLVARAIERLERSGDRQGLKHALRATTTGRLEVAWR